MNIKLSGRIDSSTAAGVEAEISRKLAEAPGEVPVFDASELEYVSSAGLRVLLKFRKQFGKNLDVINASSEVCDIFEVTGFNQLLNVKKKLREISIDGCEVIGGGNYSTVYRLDPETIVKVFDKHKMDQAKIESDQRISREAFLHDIPTAISYDVVRVGEYYGIVYEMIDADTMSSTLRKHPERLEELSIKAARIMKKLHTTEFEPGTFPDARLGYHERISAVLEKGFISEGDAAAMHEVIDRVPYRNTFVHGDFHPNNLLVTGGDMTIIDVGDASLGHPVLDLAISYAHFVRLSRFSAEHNSSIHARVIGLDYKMLGAIWDIMMPEYFGTEDNEAIARAEKLLEGYSSFFMMSVFSANKVPIPYEVKKQILSGIVHPLLEAASSLKPMEGI